MQRGWKVKRLVINLTTFCNECCPFCVVEASNTNKKFMSLQTLKTILNSYQENIEVQLTGGEPTLHPEFLECVRAAAQRENVQTLIIDTNGTGAEELTNAIYELSNQTAAQIKYKISVNYWLLNKHPNHLERTKALIEKYKNCNNFHIILSVAHRVPDEIDNYILARMKEEPFSDIKKIIHPISYQGRAIKNKLPNCCAEKLKITSAEPVGYAVDGTCFGFNLEARNKYELEQN